MDIFGYFLCFAVFSFIGWLYESVYYTIQQRKVINSGFLTTCFCPIYGIGALLDLIFLGRIENTFMLFAAGMILTGALEYFVSWLMEALFHQRWWDYTGWPMNINGRICILSVGVFGFATVLLIKVVAPFTFDMITSMNTYAMHISSVVIAAVMVADAVKSIRRLDTEKLWYVERQADFIANNKIINKIKHSFRR